MVGVVGGRAGEGKGRCRRPRSGHAKKLKKKNMHLKESLKHLRNLGASAQTPPWKGNGVGGGVLFGSLRDCSVVKGMKVCQDLITWSGMQ